jgi:hypothetical protein
VLGTLLSLFQSRLRLELEILALRHQLIILRRTAPKRARLRAVDRLLFVLLYRLWPGILVSITIIKPDTVVRWHRRGFSTYWRWRSRWADPRSAMANCVGCLISAVYTIHSCGCSSW